jgi:hypothetical protein
MQALQVIRGLFANCISVYPASLLHDMNVNVPTPILFYLAKIFIVTGYCMHDAAMYGERGKNGAAHILPHT